MVVGELDGGGDGFTNGAANGTTGKQSSEDGDCQSDQKRWDTNG